MTKVRVAMGRTVNLGNYESFKIEIAIEEDINGETPNNYVDTKIKFLKSKLTEYGAGFNGT